jgi:hypothetical protein
MKHKYTKKDDVVFLQPDGTFEPRGQDVNIWVRDNEDRPFEFQHADDCPCKLCAWGQIKKVPGSGFPLEVGVSSHHPYWGEGKETERGFLPRIARCEACKFKCPNNKAQQEGQ